ncbi:MAG: NAD(P)/FAD-dependent oxidoreductase, partial [Cyanobacteria bacterium P01_G01_bin.38]
MDSRSQQQAQSKYLDAAPSEAQTFDAIVIGSGIGGLTVAALLTKLRQQRVLVLEQHFTAGGFTHSFSRKGKFHWDVGLHYVGDMGSGGTGRAVFDYLTESHLEWQKMPDAFETFVYPDFSFAVHSDAKQFQADLIRQFPNESVSIQQYFKDVQKAAFWFGAHAMLELLPSWLHPLLRNGLRVFGAIARQTTQQYLDRHFQDAHLKALLVSQWGDYGLPPSQSCFGIHGVIVTHYFEGGWYPVGGAQAIAKTMLPVIEQAGGVVLTQRRVTEILINDGTAVGVKVQNVANKSADRTAETYYAPTVVSDVGVFNTYMRLIPQSYSLPMRPEIQAFPKGNSVLTVYLGLKESAQKLGFQGENHWIYTSYDHDEIAHAAPLDKFSQSCYLSFPSLKDPLAKGHTAEIIAHIPYDFFLQWRQQPWRRRGQDYADLKAQLTASLIQLVEDHYPGFADLIEYAELSTPLTVEHFDASDRGVIYGVPCIPERLDQPWAAARTPIKNLYLTG